MDLKEIQKKICKIEKKNKWLNTRDRKVVFLTEELGEVVRWVRKAREKKLTKKEKEELSYEFADVLQHLISLANSFGIDLEEGLRKKKGL